MAIDLTQVNIDYTTKDFATFRQDMFSLADQFTPEWNNRPDSDFGVMLVNEFALGLDILSFYQDRIANESFLPTAQLRKSVINLLSLIDYQLDTAIPGSGDVVFTIGSSATNTVIFVGYQVATEASSTEEAISFEVVTSLTIPAGYVGRSVPDSTINIGDTSATFDFVTGMVIGQQIILYNTAGDAEKVTVNNIVSLTVTWDELTVNAYSPTNSFATGLFTTATEGTAVNSETLGTSPGVPDQEFTLASAPVVETTVSVIVTESGTDIAYTRVENFIASTSTDRHFTTKVNEVDEVTLTFGNGTLGKIPPATSPIVASYRVGGGIKGNVGANLINQLISTTPANVETVTNPLASSGGSDRETIEQAKKDGPRTVKTNDRAVTKDDYEALASSFSSANGAVDQALAIATTYDNVDIFPAVQGPSGKGALPSAGLKADLKTFLDSKSMIHVTTTIKDPTYSDFNITTDLKVLANFDATDVQANVNTALFDFLDFKNQVFGGTLHVSDAYNLITNVQGVDFTNVTAFHRDGDPVAIVDVTATQFEIFQPGTITINLI